jgi:hypothetical protein
LALGTGLWTAELRGEAVPFSWFSICWWIACTKVQFKFFSVSSVSAFPVSSASAGGLLHKVQFQIFPVSSVSVFSVRSASAGGLPAQKFSFSIPSKFSICWWIACTKVQFSVFFSKFSS